MLVIAGPKLLMFPLLPLTAHPGMFKVKEMCEKKKKNNKNVNSAKTKRLENGIMG